MSMSKNSLMLSVGEVYKKPKYWIITAAVTTGMLLLNSMLLNYQALRSIHEVSVAVKIVVNSFAVLPVHSVMLTSAMSVLSGIFVSLVAYRAKQIKEMRKSLLMGSGGAIINILIPSCATCGIGLLTLLGLGGIVGSLPLKGVEIGIAGVILLTASVVMISKKIQSKVCE